MGKAGGCGCGTPLPHQVPSLPCTSGHLMVLLPPPAWEMGTWGPQACAYWALAGLLGRALAGGQGLPAALCSACDEKNGLVLVPA